MFARGAKIIGTSSLKFKQATEKEKVEEVGEGDEDTQTWGFLLLAPSELMTRQNDA